MQFLGTNPNYISPYLRTSVKQKKKKQVMLKKRVYIVLSSISVMAPVIFYVMHILAH